MNSTNLQIQYIPFTPIISNNATSSAVNGSSRAELNIYYAMCEMLVAVFAVVGNAMVIVVFRKERRLRRRTNYYIVSLAAADFLVGLLGIPFAIMASIGLPTNLHACLFTVSLLVVLCTISIFCLVAVSVDRYWAILHPMAYSRNVRTKTALVIISICWVSGSFVGFLPLLGWHRQPDHNHCLFVDVMDYNYLVFLYLTTIITPALVLLAFYAHIYRVVLKQRRQIVTMKPFNIDSSSSRTSCETGNTTMLRMLGAAQKREVKATQNLSIIVLFFMICWLPLYTINCIQAFCSSCTVEETVMNISIILSHLNSAGNPVLYAYHLKDFRAAMKLYLYHLIGLQAEEIPADLQHRASIGSNLYFKQYNNSIAQRRRNRQDSKNVIELSQQNKLYANSPHLVGNRLSKNTNISTSQTMASVISNTVAVVAISANTDKSGKENFQITDHFSENDASQHEINPIHVSLKRSISATSLNRAMHDICSDGDNLFLISGIKQSTLLNVENVQEKTKVYPITCLSCSSSQISRPFILIENGDTSNSIENNSNKYFFTNRTEQEHNSGAIVTTNLNSFKVVKEMLYSHSPDLNLKANHN